jgi:excisionase family DNA binding protein
MSELRVPASVPSPGFLAGTKAELRVRLEAVLAPEMVSLIETYVAQSVAEAIAQHAAKLNGDRTWLTLSEAGERLGVSADAIRMRVRRGRLEARRQGRRVYVRAASVDRLG